MNTPLRGRVQSGKGDASRWLTLFSASYTQKLGHPVYPGSLNLALDREFNWFDSGYTPHIIRFDRIEYGGERGIMLLSCDLNVPDRRGAWLWTTTTAARDRPDSWVIELVSDVRLRDKYKLVDGSIMELTLRLGQDTPTRFDSNFAGPESDDA